MGAETVLPLRSLKTNCDWKLRLSDFAAEAETAKAETKKMGKRKVILVTEGPPMHSIGTGRKRFFDIFSIKQVDRVPASRITQQLVVRRLLESIRRRERNWMRIALAFMLLASADILTGCAATRLPSSAGAAAPKTVYVVHHGSLHTGLTIKRSDV